MLQRLLIILLLIVPSIRASDIRAATLILEAGGEYHVGSMEAVNEVILNRAARRKLSPDEVCLQPRQFSCWNNITITRGLEIARAHPRFEEALKIVGSAKTDHVAGADHYHATNIKEPRWARGMIRTRTIGRHTFYKS